MLIGPPLLFDPHDPEFLEDPYETYATFRDIEPVAVVEPYGNHWVFDYANVERVITDNSVFGKEFARSTPGVAGPFRVMSRFPRGLFGSDPPRHTALRGAVEPIVKAGFRDAPKVAAEVASQLLEKVSDRPYMELMSDYAMPLPAAVLFSVMGVPAHDWDAVGRWVFAIAAAHDITQRPSVRAMGATCAMALKTYFTGFVAETLETPNDGVIGHLCLAACEGSDVTASDIETVCMDFVVAGYLSTSYLIGTGLRAILNEPPAVEELRSDPELMPGAIREMLRYEAPAQIVDRVVLKETDLAGHHLLPGMTVSAVVGAANRDPSVFTDPDKFDIRRDDARHLSFGAGIHECIGNALVNLVAPVAMSELLLNADLAIDGLAQWQTDPYLRGMTSLPVRRRRS